MSHKSSTAIRDTGTDTDLTGGRDQTLNRLTTPARAPHRSRQASSRLQGMTPMVLLSLALSILIPGLRAQETVTLYLEPDTSGQVVDTLPAGDPRLESATAMAYDGDQPLIWKMFELADTFEGFVEKAEVTKGMTVESGALVYFGPGKDSAFLTILEEDNDAQVVGVEEDWAKISVTASLPVYFQSKAPEKVQEPEPAPPPAEVAGEPFPDPPSLAQDRAPGSRRSVDLPPPRTKSGVHLDRKLEGLLRRIPKSGIFARQPKYDWELVDSKNRRIAFVDPGNLILNRPFETLEGRKVILSGPLSELEDGRNMLIVARQIVAQ